MPRRKTSVDRLRSDVRKYVEDDCLPLALLVTVTGKALRAAALSLYYAGKLLLALALWLCNINRNKKPEQNARKQDTCPCPYRRKG